MKLSLLRSRGFGLILAAVVVLLAFAFVVARSGPLAPTRVTVTKVGEGQIAPALFGIGTVEAQRAYLIGPTAAGRVLRVLVDVGDTVKAGQLLAEMDPVDLDERIAALDASMARANNAVTASGAQRRDAEARNQLAAMNARRYKDLGDKKFVSSSAVEAKLQEDISARAGFNAADANLAAARQDTLRLAAERNGLRQQRDNVRLLAPRDGVVTARDAEPGSTVVAGQAVLKLIEPASLWVKTRFDQGRSAGLAKDLAAEIALRSNPSRLLPGKVARVDPVSDSVTEERIAQIAFDTLPDGIALGELAEVTLRLPASPARILIPNASLKRQGEQSGVWVHRSGKAEFVAVKPGKTSLDGQVEILEGLSDGEQVITHSEKEITADSSLKVVDSLAGAGK
ncbi:MAG: efflux RND transporter periplasmic adaptor subunit [Azonexus sp.]